jgi:hypothetical protein
MKQLLLLFLFFAVATLNTIYGQGVDENGRILPVVAGMPAGTATGQINYWNGTTWQTIDPGNDGTVLKMVGTTPVWVTLDGPVITVTSDTDTVQTGNPWTDAGATADGGETVTASGSVDTNVAGTYTVVYSAIDEFGNFGIARRTVTVYGLSIGGFHQGGIIFSLDGNGGGFIAASTDQSGAPWGCDGTTISGASGTLIGTGAQNTIAIEAECTTTGTAADICANLTLSGYSDWFLPSRGEVNLMYQNIGQGNALGLGNVGGFADLGYWSSTEYGAGAWNQYFRTGSQGYAGRNSTLLFRAVRTF